jgi:NAD(P)H-quinone oxidoreductase subunit 5
VGDFGLLLGILGLFWATRSFDFAIMGDRLHAMVENGTLSGSIAALFAILVFLGPVAKSAQFPLHVWLPDAMEGPTPISALIHAATMVAAGVFLIARMFPVFSQIPVVMDTIAWTGAITAFIGATTAITQNDIKKGLAYSTMSQLGYMVLAMGVGAYSAGLFHLVTHAFFKAMLFLGSGSVIHGMEEAVGHNPAYAQDMRLMGGLRKLMPITATTFLIGTLAICGIPPFAGFWSKDEILHRAYEANPNLWFIGFVTAGITAFYMFRMYFQTFEGELRATDSGILNIIEGEQLRKMGIAAGPGAMNAKELGAVATLSHDDHDEHHGDPHESPLTMTLPLMVLAIPSMFIGLLGTPFANYFEAFIHAPGEVFVQEPVDLPEFLIMGGSSVGIGLVGISIAILMYLQKKMDPTVWANRFPTLYALSKNKWYFDEIYDAVFVRPSRGLARQVLEVDYKVVDGVVNLTGFLTLLTGEGLKYIENGRAQFYALIIFGAVIVFVIASGFA